MADKIKGSKDAKDFEKGFNAGGGNPFDFVVKMYNKVREPASEPSPSPASTQCPNCGHTLGEEINYPQGSS